MKIGILTFVETNNYGAALQAYALQQVILREGHSCEIIKYNCKKIQKVHNPYKAIRNGIRNRILSPVIFPALLKLRKEFKQFEDKYCTFSPRCDESNIAEIADGYDRIIVGSDQVWNTTITGKDKSFFLDFIDDNKKKCSYAASIGTKYFTQNADEYEALLKQFQIISVRERGTAEQLKEKLLREDISADVDPTLLNYYYWDQFITKENRYGKYIFLYFIPKDPVLFDAIKQFAKEKECGLVLLQRGIRKRKSIQSVTFASPLDFLNLIAHAQYVISGSFHALCFSLIFKKDFYVTEAPVKGRSERLTDLLSSLGLDERFVAGPDYCFVESVPNYDVIDEKLREDVTSSMKTISRICSDINGVE